MRIVLDASKTNPEGKCKSIARYVQNYPREIQTNSLILAKIPRQMKTNQPILVFNVFKTNLKEIQTNSLIHGAINWQICLGIGFGRI